MKSNNNKFSYLILGALILLFVVFYVILNDNINSPQNIQPNNTGNIGTGVIDYTGSVLTGKEYHQIQFNDPIVINNSVVKNNLYPAIKINDQVSNVKVSFEVDFTDYFKKLYSSYINAPRYYFAFKFFVGDISNGGFYDVTRNELGGVSNTKDGLLKGALLGKNIVGGYARTIPGVDAKIANSDRIGYSTFSFQNIINNNIGSELRIGGYLSSTKDMKGWNFTTIKNIKIEYQGKEGAIEFIK